MSSAYPIGATYTKGATRFILVLHEDDAVSIVGRRGRVSRLWEVSFDAAVSFEQKLETRGYVDTPHFSAGDVAESILRKLP